MIPLFERICFGIVIQEPDAQEPLCECDSKLRPLLEVWMIRPRDLTNLIYKLKNCSSQYFVFVSKMIRLNLYYILGFFIMRFLLFENVTTYRACTVYHSNIHLCRPGMGFISAVVMDGSITNIPLRSRQMRFVRLCASRSIQSRYYLHSL